MNTTSNKYAIDQIRKGIPINGQGVVNFEAIITTKSSKPFYMAVIDMDSLNTSVDIPYRTVSEQQNSITIKNENNIPKQFFLVLKSDTAQEVTVSIAIRTLPYNNGQTTSGGASCSNGNCGGTSLTADGSNTPSSNVVWYKDKRYWIGIGILMLIIFFLIWKGKSRRSSNMPEVIEMDEF